MRKMAVKTGGTKRLIAMKLLILRIERSDCIFLSIDD